MSSLAQKLAKVPPPTSPTRRGPANQCFPLYGAGDLEDWQAVEKMRSEGHDWRGVQQILDGKLGIERPLHNDKFRYHWGRKCFCWPEDLRR